MQTEYASEGIIQSPPIENRRDKIISRVRPDLFNTEFKTIWDRLKVKTDFHSDIDTNQLVENSKKSIQDNLFVRKPLIDIRRANIEFKETSIGYSETESAPIKQLDFEYSIPDIITRIAEDTVLTRKTISLILLGCNRLRDIFNNPEEFVSKVSTLIMEQKIAMEVEKSTYTRNRESYSDNIFEKELSSYKRNVIESNSSLYDKVLCDNPSEATFAKDMSRDNQIKLFCKLPQQYYIGINGRLFDPELFDADSTYGRSYSFSDLSRILAFEF